MRFIVQGKRQNQTQEVTVHQDMHDEGQRDWGEFEGALPCVTLMGTRGAGSHEDAEVYVSQANTSLGMPSCQVSELQRCTTLHHLQHPTDWTCRGQLPNG